MGLFLSMSGVARSDLAAVEDSLHRYAEARHGTMTQSKPTGNSWEFLVVCEAPKGRVTVVYPGSFYEWDSASEHLSQSLRVPVFSFHIHDEDLWTYVLFDKGQEVDHFNPIPDYWSEKISDEERRIWAGDAKAVAQHWPDLKTEQIAKYLARWDLDDDKPKKAYADDQHPPGDCWQLLDFMRRLGLKYPVDDQGRVTGHAYRFEVPPPEDKATK